MEAIVRTKYLRISPRKVRQVADLIRGKGVNDAVDLLHFMPKKAAQMLEKSLKSAVANLMHQEGGRKIEIENVVVKKAMIDCGPVAKRFRAGPMGRGLRIRKRFSHITLTVGEK